MTQGFAVGIGASVGGLVALQRLFGKLQPCPRAAFFVVQHRAPEAGNRLLSLLAPRSAMPWSEPSDREPVELGKIYLAPPDYHLLIDRGEVSLSIDAPVLFARPSVDVLLESLADAYGPRTAAVILTGASRDGADGARKIAQRGGVVIVQTPATAESPVAPKAALELVPSAEVLDVEDIARRLVAVSGGTDPAAPDAR